MRRSGPLKRKTELKRLRKPGSRQRGRLILSRESYAQLVWNVVWGQSCACGCGRRAETLHHLVPRGGQGDDVIENGCPLAGDGTRLCHGALTTGQRTYDLDTKTYIEPLEVAYGIRAWLDTKHRERRSYIVRKKSLEWLDRRYPRREETP